MLSDFPNCIRTPVSDKGRGRLLEASTDALIELAVVPEEDTLRRFAACPRSHHLHLPLAVATAVAEIVTAMLVARVVKGASPAPLSEVFNLALAQAANRALVGLDLGDIVLVGGDEELRRFGAGEVGRVEALGVGIRQDRGGQAGKKDGNGGELHFCGC